MVLKQSWIVPAVSKFHFRGHKKTLEGGKYLTRADIAGWDHGVFVPMKLINPSGSVPIVQMSILASQKAPDLLRVGQALRPLRDQNVAIVGSGSPSYHNLRDWLSGRTALDTGFKNRQIEWHQQLDKTLEEKVESKRWAALENWRDFPHSFEMHPPNASEHFSTLLVCAGTAGDADAHCSRFKLMGAEQHTCWWD